MFAFFFYNPYIKCHCQREFREVFGGYVTCWPRGDANGVCQVAGCQKNIKKGLKNRKKN